jgi:hypothetical protein
MALLDRQLARVRRRLFLETLLALLAWLWLGALLGAAGWLLVQPYVLAETPLEHRWAAAGGLVALASALAIVLAVLHRPSPVVAALALDARFGLKERVTSSLTLSPQEAISPAGQALLADVEGRLAGVRIAERFPVRPPWKAMALLPLVAAAVVLLALFWNPRLGASDSSDDSQATAPEAKEDIEKKMNQLAVKPKAKKAEEPPKSEDLQRIDAEIEKFTRKSRDTREEVRERVKDATELEEMIRRQQKQQVERLDALKERMQQAERLTRKNRAPKDGPAKNAADAVARGDMDRAAAEMRQLAEQMEKEEKKERLRRKMRDPKASEEEKKKAQEELEKLEKESKLSRKEREQMEQQLQDMQDQLQRLSRNKDEIAKELEELFKEGKIDKEQLDREMDELERNFEKLSKEDLELLKEIAKDLQECKECMGEGKDGEAAKKLAKAGEKMGKLSKDGENKEMARKLVQILQVKKALCRGLGPGGAGPGAGRRPESKDKDDTGHEEKHIRGEWEKGKMEVVGHGPFGGFKGPRKPAEIQDEIRQAAQEAPAALDRQRLPPSARKMARGYFERVRGPDSKDAKKKD